MYSHYKTIAVSLCVLAATLVSCGKEPPPAPPLPEPQTTNGVIILCEGNYGLANARIDFYDKNEQTLYENVFTARNNRPLGDVAQSALLLNNEVYIVVNNSGRIEKIKQDDFSSLYTASGFMSPRYILPVNSSTAYVSDLYANKLYVLNMPGMSISGSIPLNGWAEEMILAGQEVFVCNYEKNYVYTINTQQHTISDSIFTASTPGSAVKDKNGYIWVLCGGNMGQTVVSRLVQINPATHAVMQNIELSGIDNAFKVRINTGGDRLYFLGSNKIYTMAVNESTAQVFYGESGHNWYGLRVDPLTGYIWAADALSYNQNGKVYILKPDGSIDKSFSTGVIPGDFLFYD